MKRSLSLSMLLLLACGSEESHTSTAAEESTTTTTATTSAVSNAGSSPIDLTDADLDQYARGIAKEIELVKAARERGASASTPAERGAAAQAEWEDQTIPTAAKAAGIAEDRYRQTRKAVHTVLETLDFQGKIDGPLEMDLTRADEATKTRLAKDAFSTLSASSADRLRARMETLFPLWNEYMSLTALHG